MVVSQDRIDAVIATYQKATTANQDTASRQGNTIVLSPVVADEVMVTADLHGNRLNFNKICQIADLDGHPQRHLMMQEVCHGGPAYPTEGGCMSHTLLEDVALLKVEHPGRVHFILSNHELAELTDYPIIKARKMLNLLFRSGLQQMYGEAAEAVRQAMLPFLRSLPLAVRLSTGIMICHSLPAQIDSHPFDPGVLDRPLEDADLIEGGAAFRLVWGRDYQEENAAAFARLVGAEIVITGHEPCVQGYLVPNSRQIILDCSGNQACYVMLPTTGKLSQQEIVQRIKSLNNNEPIQSPAR